MDYFLGALTKEKWLAQKGSEAEHLKWGRGVDVCA